MGAHHVWIVIASEYTPSSAIRNQLALAPVSPAVDAQISLVFAVRRPVAAKRQWTTMTAHKSTRTYINPQTHAVSRSHAASAGGKPLPHCGRTHASLRAVRCSGPYGCHTVTPMWAHVFLTRNMYASAPDRHHDHHDHAATAGADAMPVSPSNRAARLVSCGLELQCAHHGQHRSPMA